MKHPEPVPCRSLLAGDGLAWHGRLARGFAGLTGETPMPQNRPQAGSYLGGHRA